MATNRTMADNLQRSVVVSNPATPASGDPVRFGAFTGVALVDEGDGGNAATETTVDFGPRQWKLSVKGVDDSGNSAVAVGDFIFYVDADTPKLSKKSSGYLFGIADETVSSGATATIKVSKIISPGAGTLAAGAVGATQLATAAVTAAKLSATLKTGFIPISLTLVREITANDIPNGAGNGGLLASDTTPTLARVNGATDQKLRITWAASGADPIAFDFQYPPDIDAASDLTICILAAMEGATDTPVIGVAYFEGVGDADAGGNTLAVTGTVVAEYTRAIAAADVGVHPNAASVMLTPAAHTTDALYIYAIWVEYTRA